MSKIVKGLKDIKRHKRKTKKQIKKNLNRLKSEHEQQTSYNINILIRSLNKHIDNYGLDSKSLPIDEKVNIYCEKNNLNYKCSGKASAYSLLARLKINNDIYIRTPQKETIIENKMKEILNNNNIEYEAQYEIGRYYADFYVKEINTVIEVDGRKFHSGKKALTGDYTRQNYIVCKGYKILRYFPEQINEKRVMRDINELR